MKLRRWRIKMTEKEKIEEQKQEQQCRITAEILKIKDKNILINLQSVIDVKLQKILKN